MNELIELVEKYLQAIDHEMDHGDYHVPEYYIPFKFGDEDDYYAEHGRIVEDAANARIELDKMIRELKGENA